MIILAMVICLANEPNKCKDVNLQFTENISKSQCYMRAQIELAKWSSDHPNYTIQRFSCEDEKSIKTNS